MFFFGLESTFIFANNEGALEEGKESKLARAKIGGNNGSTKNHWKIEFEHEIFHGSSLCCILLQIAIRIKYFIHSGYLERVQECAEFRSFAEFRAPAS